MIAVVGELRREPIVQRLGEVSGDEMGGTYSSPPECGSDTGTWEAQLIG